MPEIRLKIFPKYPLKKFTLLDCVVSFNFKWTMHPWKCKYTFKACDLPRYQMTGMDMKSPDYSAFLIKLTNSDAARWVPLHASPGI